MTQLVHNLSVYSLMCLDMAMKSDPSRADLLTQADAFAESEISRQALRECIDAFPEANALKEEVAKAIERHGGREYLESFSESMEFNEFLDGNEEP